MVREKRIDIEDIAEIGEEAVATINALIDKYADTENVVVELKALRVYAEVLAEKPAKIATLRDFKGYKFAVIDETTGQPRPATYDESMRLIMGYKKGNILNIMREWTVVNGEWVKRPATNPDGTPVART